MKILKYLFFLILIIVIGGAIYFGTKDGSYDVSDSKIIDAPIEVVFNKVNEYKTWENWGPWKNEDPTMRFSYAEKTSGEGASYSWEGEMSGSMQTTKVIPNSEIQQELTLNTPAGERNSQVYWLFEEVEGGTKVTWGMKGDHPMIDKIYYEFGDMDFNATMHDMNIKGLEGIAEAVQNDMKEYTVNVDGVNQYGGGFYMYNTTASKQTYVLKKMESMFAQVKGYMEQNKIPASGNPFILYNAMDDLNNTVIFSAAVPVRDRVITPEGSPIISGLLEAGTAVKTTLKGNYTNLSEAYSAAKKYINENNFQQDPNARTFEVYVTNPEETPNPAEWITEIYIPIILQTEAVEDSLVEPNNLL